MADPTVLAEAYRRNLLPPEKAQAYEEGVRRGLVPADASIKALISQRASDPKSTMTVGGLVRRDVTGQGPKPNVFADMARSGFQGTVEGLASLSGAFNQADAMKTGADLGTWAMGKLRGSSPEQIAAQQNALSRYLPTTSTQALKAGHIDYQPQTEAGRYARVAGNMLPNAALGPGNALRRGAAVVLPTLASEGSRQLAEGMGANQTGQAVASTVGALAGGLASGARIGPRPINQAAQAESALAQFAKKTKQSPQAMAAQIQRYKAAGIEPTLVDVVDESGRGVVRAAASRMTPGREVAANYARGKVLGAQDEVSNQARRVISQDPRTPQEIAGDLSAKRGALADTQYGAVRDQTFTPTPEAVAALRTPLGRAAIKAAAEGERNPDVRAALNRLSDVALDHPNEPMTVGMADGIAKALNGRGAAHARAGDNNLASMHFQAADDIRAAAAHPETGVPAYAEAVGNYAQGSRMMDAAGRGEDFLKRNTDEFVTDVNNMSPEEQIIARATARRAIERVSGENPASAIGVADRLANAREQGMRSEALLGPVDAGRLREGMDLTAQSVRNANDISPRSGSQTAPRLQDLAETGGAAVRLGGKVARGDLVGTLIDGTHMWLKARGMSDVQAEQLVRLATDPRKTEAAFKQLSDLYGPTQARAILKNLKPARLAPAATAAYLTTTNVAAQQPQP